MSLSKPINPDIVEVGIERLALNEQEIGPQDSTDKEDTPIEVSGKNGSLDQNKSDDFVQQRFRQFEQESTAPSEKGNAELNQVALQPQESTPPEEPKTQRPPTPFYLPEHLEKIEQQQRLGSMNFQMPYSIDYYGNEFEHAQAILDHFRFVVPLVEPSEIYQHPEDRSLYRDCPQILETQRDISDEIELARNVHEKEEVEDEQEVEMTSQELTEFQHFTMDEV
ncbi:unnamed protein product [Caenorhabditis bovis]|uniref:Uncharacterized protein n=1 Tax=Caenorhabditis bovis TaxID=2654633 RepID=A0A8S1ENG5_9PELO|nr:unnamed protein product [Caenorhabditis bovis]